MYYDLLAQLRRCAEGRCRGCPRSHAEGCRKSVSTEAADAIEELTQKEKFHAFLWNTIQPNEMELYIAMYRAQAVPQEPPKEE